MDIWMQIMTSFLCWLIINLLQAILLFFENGVIEKHQVFLRVKILKRVRTTGSVDIFYFGTNPHPRIPSFHETVSFVRSGREP